jgi:polyhydroxyalkanoate synthesis regulator phasin
MAQKRSTAGKSKSGARATGKSATAKTASAKSRTAKSSTAKSRTAKSTTARSTTAKSKSASSRTAASRKAAASKGGKTTARKRTARKAAGATAATTTRGARSAGIEAKSVAELREALRKNLIRPMDMVMISRERIEEVLGEAVDQGRVTARDAQRITSGLVKRGQRQTSDVLKDLENLLGRGRDEIGGARTRAVRTASPALAQVDRVRRGAGVGASFPITGYDDLTAPQVTGRLGSLRPAELRKVRDHERRNANRKTVIGAIESLLG